MRGADAKAQGQEQWGPPAERKRAVPTSEGALFVRSVLRRAVLVARCHCSCAMSLLLWCCFFVRLPLRALIGTPILVTARISCRS